MSSQPKNPLTPLEQFSDFCTRSVGSSTSLVVHTLFFVSAFVLGLLGVPWNTVLLVLTTVVSLEAIYLSILIQISVNRNTKSLEVVEENVDEIQEDIGEIQGDVDEIQEDVDEIQEDIGEIQEDVDEISEEVDEISEDVSVDTDTNTDKTLKSIEKSLATLAEEIDKLRKTVSK